MSSCTRLWAMPIFKPERLNGRLPLTSKGLKETPGTRVFHGLAKTHLGLGETRKAIETLTDGIQISHSPVLYDLLGQIYLNQKDVDRAILTFEEGLDENPNAELFASLGRVLLERGETEKAKLMFEKSTEHATG